MKQFTSLLLIIFLSQLAIAQISNRVRIYGKIVEAETLHPLASATINCLLAKDSIQKALVFSDKNGLFSIDSIQRDNYVLHISFLGYKPTIYPITIPLEKKTVDIGLIRVERATLTLTEIEIIETKSPIRITKDTIEFNTSFFKTKANSVVEDLLKKIPGIQIDADGTIRANGKIIQNIMIDGRELFRGGNSTIITRNLQADLIDKVQLIDRNRGQDEKNGMLNNQHSSIINITIKENKHNSISGELTTAYGTSSTFANKINLSKFNNHQQLMVIADGNNVNGVIDKQSIGQAGITQSYNGGGSYSDEINRRTTIGINYLTNYNKAVDQRTSLRNTIISDSILYYNQEASSMNNIYNHDLNTRIDYKIDSLQNINILLQTSLNRTSNQSLNNFESSGTQFKKINIGNTNNIIKNKNFSLSGNLGYDKKFKKPGRSLSGMIAYGRGNGDDNGINIANNSYFFSNSEILSDTINQKISKNEDSKRIFLSFNYIEPVITNGSISILVAKDYTYNLSDIIASNYNNNSRKYDIMNDSLSNQFRSITTQHYLRLGWIFQKDKFDYSLSLAYLLFNMKNSNIGVHDNYIIHSSALLPEANFSYLFSKNRRLLLSYRKNQQFPEIFQLQPVRDNANPMHIKIGNNSLKPMSTDNISLSYNNFNIKSFQSLSISLNGKRFHDQIIYASWYDSLGREVVQPINLDGSYLFDMNIDNSLPMKKKQNVLTLNTKGSLGRAVNSLNGTNTFNNTFLFSQSIGFSCEYKNLLKYSISGSASYNRISYSSAKISSFQYLSSTISFVGDINLPYGITVSTNANFGWAAGRMKGYNAVPFMLNASISKTIFPHEQAVIKLQGLDLLKQNISISRIVRDNYIEDVRAKALERFFIIGFSYYLGKNRN